MTTRKVSHRSASLAVETDIANICFLPGSAMFTVPGRQNVAPMLPTSNLKQITFTSGRIDLSIEFRRVGSDVYKSFESTNMYSCTEISRRSYKVDISTLPLLIASEAGKTSSAPIDRGGLLDLCDNHDETCIEVPCSTEPKRDPET